MLLLGTASKKNVGLEPRSPSSYAVSGPPRISLQGVVPGKPIKGNFPTVKSIG